MDILSPTANWRLLGTAGILASADLKHATFSKVSNSTGSITENTSLCRCLLYSF